jgi:hypothetical protein
MPRLATQIPRLRHHKASGRAIVLIDGREIYLGKFGTIEASELYDRIIAERLSGRRQSRGTEKAVVAYGRAVVQQREAAQQIAAPVPVSVNEVCCYLKWAQTYYVRDGKTP